MSDTVASVILRSLPERKGLMRITGNRYTKSDFEKFNELASVKGNIEKCRILESGRNYRTNRKIKVDGKLYKQLISPFYVFYEGYRQDEKGEGWSHSIRGGMHLFTILCDIDEKEYMAESEKLEGPINEQNRRIREFNKSVDDAIQKIHSLEKWSDYVEFDGLKYGLPSILNGIHRYSDCLGKIESKQISSSCHSCEYYFGGCGGHCSGDRYEEVCSKCGGADSTKFCS